MPLILMIYYCYPLEIFKETPEILAKYQNRWKYVLVDEYQDTNKPQFFSYLK